MDSKIKLMTYNVWADVFGNPVHPRDKLLCELVREERIRTHGELLGEGEAVVVSVAAGTCIRITVPVKSTASLRIALTHRHHLDRLRRH